MNCPYCNQNIWITQNQLEKCHGCGHVRTKERGRVSPTLGHTPDRYSELQKALGSREFRGLSCQQSSYDMAMAQASQQQQRFWNSDEINSLAESLYSRAFGR